MAGLIPKSFIHDLLDRADVVEVVDSRVPLKKAGRNYQACCPFHNEKTPSFTVAPDKQFYHCFGCGEHGNAIDFLMAYDGLEFPDAVEELASMMGVEVPRETSANPQAEARKRQQAADDYQQMERATQFFSYQLRKHKKAPEVIEYLKGRGLSGEIVKQFQIGYAPDGWDDLLKSLAKDQRSRDQLVDLKLVNRNDNGRYYDFFRDRIMFPIRDRRGRVVGFGGRIISGDGPKYLNSPETRIFHKGRELYGFYEVKQAHRSIEQVVIVEGYMDVVALAQAGIDFAVASLGTATTTEQLQMLFRATRQVTCCYDGDRAGRDAAWRALENALPLLTDGLQLNFLFLPDGEDPDSLVRQEGAEAFKARLGEAQSFTQYFFAHLTETLDLATDSGRAMLLSQAKPLIEKVASDYYREELLQELARLLRREVSQVAGQMKAKAAPTANRDELKMTPIRRAIALLLQYPQLGQEVPLHEELAQLKLPGIPVLLKLHRQTREHSLTPAQLLEQWRGTREEKLLRQLMSWEHHLEQDKISQEFFDTFLYFIDLFVEQRANELLAKERQAPLTAAEKREYMALLRHKAQKHSS
ncbi:DNA primase [Pseudidiomarina insulisalsae]|uniref:DNA primase n=1 Tax=Pseudidiomarina insulisalsae TaxID=575789 RepID=A0A432YCY9_9GAMM|nr:DNA primase [Pseudidiomarina insulisalsae]RUO58712.1 DNA primase [Pseudidiomarina insulisalsae]